MALCSLIVEDENEVLVGDAEAWVYADSALTTLVDGPQRTDDQGIVVFDLTVGTDYWLRLRKSGYVSQVTGFEAQAEVSGLVLPLAVPPEDQAEPVTIRSTADLLDYMALQYGDVGTTTKMRTHMLRWLQAAELDVCALEPWWFLREEEAFEFDEGVRIYTMPDSVTWIAQVVNTDEQILEFLPFETFRRLFGADETVGVPRRYTILPRSYESALVRIEIWPAPDPTSLQGRVVKLLKGANLSDSGSSFSVVPPKHCMVTVYRALRSMSEHDGQAQLVQVFAQEEERALNAMRQEHIAHIRGRFG